MATLVKNLGPGHNEYVPADELFDPHYEIHGNEGHDWIRTWDGNDVLFGDSGNDTLSTGTGDDKAWGGAGDDLISSGDWGKELVFERLEAYGGSGNDTIVGDVGHDKLYGDEGHDRLYGGWGADTVVGGSGNDLLFGSDDFYFDDGWTDYLRGGNGNDTYVGVEFGNDKVIEDVAGGYDTVIVQTGSSYTLPDFVEVLKVDAPRDSYGFVSPKTGSFLQGNGLHNLIEGGIYNDYVSALGGDDAVYGGQGKDTLWGGSGNDWLAGETGNDKLYGDSGHDGLYGGLGDDELHGGTGYDTLDGGAENDTLFGEDGHDRLTGSYGDKLYGGTGNDTYVVDAIAQVIETAGQGTDQVITSAASYTLSANVENLSFTGAKETGKGNDLDNILSGGAGKSVLYGLGGNDQLNGAIGDDFLYGGDGEDVLKGWYDNDYLSGQAGNDKLYGDIGNDVLNGGAGIDRLEGGYGADTFVYNSVLHSTYGSVDKIVNFDFGQDRIDLHLIDADTTQAGNQQFWYNAGGKPFFGAPGTLWTEFSGAGIRILGDVNGDNVADLVITVFGSNVVSSTFTAGDFIL